MKFGPRKVRAAVVFVLTMLLGLVAWRIAALEGLVFFVLAVATCGFIAVWYLIVQIGRRADDQQVASEDRLVAFHDDVVAASAEISVIYDKVKLLAEEFGTLAQAVPEDVADQDDHGAVPALDSRETSLYRQLEALMALYKETGSAIGFPQNRTFMAAPDLLYFLFSEARSKDLKMVMECGSGLSTLVIAYALRSRGSGRVVALEHLESYVEDTHNLLVQHGLTDWGEVLFAPLEPTTVDGQTRWWYSVEAIPEGPIDLLLVDGPPGRTGREARFPALPLLIDRLSPDAQVVMDDYLRVDEKAIVDKWLAMFPELTLEVMGHEKGTAVLHLGSSHN